jgi:hypothetical protein
MNLIRWTQNVWCVCASIFNQLDGCAKQHTQLEACRILMAPLPPKASSRPIHFRQRSTRDWPSGGRHWGQICISRCHYVQRRDGLASKDTREMGNKNSINPSIQPWISHSASGSFGAKSPCRTRRHLAYSFVRKRRLLRPALARNWQCKSNFQNVVTWVGIFSLPLHFRATLWRAISFVADPRTD